MYSALVLSETRPEYLSNWSIDIIDKPLTTKYVFPLAQFFVL